MTAHPSVSVIVVSYNRSADLRRSLEAVFASTHAEHAQLEVIVVDNASSDDAAEVAASFPRVRLVRNAENLGFAAANDVGLKLATGDYVALVNNDAVIDAAWMATLVAFLEAHPLAAAAGGKVFFWDDENPCGARSNHYYGHTLVDAETAYTRAVVDGPDQEREVATLSGAAVMIRRAAIVDVGEPFLEPLFFTYYEETDFFARALRKGWSLHYVPSAQAWHRVRGSSAPYRYFYYVQRNRLLFAYRNFSQPQLSALLRRTARDAMLEVAARPRALFGKSDDGDDESRARRDAYRWALRNRALLADQRARSIGSGVSYNERVEDVQSRAEYYGHSRPEVAALVPKGARRVVDVGCGAGALGRALKAERPELQVRGVEIVAEQAARARSVLDDAVVGSAEQPMPSGWPAPDCVIFADVLEHLVDPWSVLKHWRRALAPGGALVVSIPNVTHRSVVAGLSRGRWDYRDAGILDRTHLRFFTRETAIELVEQAGFRVVRMERLIDMWGDGPLKKPLVQWLHRPVDGAMRSSAWLDPRAAIADLYTVQYLIVGV